MTALKIDRLYAFVTEDGEGEGLMAFKSGNTWLPMVGADFKRVNSLIPIAEEMTKVTGKGFRILQFDNKIDVTEQQIKRYKGVKKP